MDTSDLLEIIPQDITVEDWGIPETPGYYLHLIPISPELAKKMLLHNLANRHIINPLVKKLADKIRKGKWSTTHQSIAFSVSGNLLDGQHRLLAIIMSGKTVLMIVSYGWPDENFKNIDSDQAVRNAASHITILDRNVKNPNALAAVATSMLSGLKCEASRLPPMEIAEFAIRHAPLIEIFLKLRSAGNKAIRKAPITAAFAAACRQNDRWPGPKGRRDISDLVDLHTRLTQQVWTGSRDPMCVLHNHLLEAHNTQAGSVRNASQRANWYAMAVTAIRAGLAGKELRSLRPATIDWGDPKDSGGSTSKLSARASKLMELLKKTKNIHIPNPYGDPAAKELYALRAKKLRQRMREAKS